MAKKSWVSHNNKVFKAYIDEHKFLLEQRINRVCQELAEEVKLYIEAFDELRDMPMYTGNLADGTGLGVYLNGALRGFTPMQSANKPQDDKELGITDIWGTEYLQDALSRATGEFSKGIWVVLFSTVPYAVRVDEEGTVKKKGKNKGATKTPAGFFSERLKGDMLDKFKTAFAKEFPNIAKQLTTI